MSGDSVDLLLRRSLMLARPLADATLQQRRLVAHFTLGGERLAIEARWLLGVTRLTSLAPLPGAEPPIRGVTVWRGDLLTVLDIRSVLGISTSMLNDLTRVLVLGDRRARFGLLADAASECTELLETALLSAPSSSMAREYLIGTTAEAELLLDGEKLLQLFD